MNQSNEDKLTCAFKSFDAYNANDPNQEEYQGQNFPKEVLYAQRMTERLNTFSPGADESLQLAARCQHIGRWEIPRNAYPMDRKGYLIWRNVLKQHHAKIAEPILRRCGYENEIIEKVKFLLLKKELYSHPDTQLMEDVICLVFIEFYLEDFSKPHTDEKVIDILKKTIKKMSKRGLEEAAKINVSERMQTLIQRAVAD